MGFLTRLLCAIIVGLIAWGAFVLFSEDDFDPKLHVFGKNMIITGASSGIGRQTAILACEMGANVFITARRENLLKEVLDVCKSVGRKEAKHGYLAADMGNLEDSKSVVLKAVELHGGIDFLILNHGHTGKLEAYRYRPEDLINMKKLYDINFFSFVQMTNTAMKYLKQSQGRIGVVSSVGGEMSGLYQAEYASTKFSISGFFGTLEHENFVKRTNVSITVFIPGAIETDMLGKFMDATRKEGIDVDKSLMASMTKGADSKQCAFALIRSTSLRQTKPYFPDNFANRAMVLFGKTFPELNKLSLRYVADDAPINQ